MNGVPAAQAHPSRPLQIPVAGPHRGVPSAGGMLWRTSNPVREPPAWRRVEEALASLVRYIETPVDTMTAGRPGSKPALTIASHQVSLGASKSTGTNHSHSGIPKPSSMRRRRFQAEGPGWSTSNTLSREPISCSALGERVEAGSQDDVLGNAPGDLLDKQIFHEPGTGHDAGPEPVFRPRRVHVGSVAPPRI